MSWASEKPWLRAELCWPWPFAPCHREHRAVRPPGGDLRRCAAAIWIAGIKRSDTADVLSERLQLGAALGGVILLAVPTNLPEIAITASAALLTVVSMVGLVFRPQRQ